LALTILEFKLCMSAAVGEKPCTTNIYVFWGVYNMAKIRIEYDVPDGATCEHCKHIHLTCDFEEIFDVKCRIFNTMLLYEKGNYYKCQECKAHTIQEEQI